MRNPKKPGSPIDIARKDDWHNRFKSFADIDRDRIFSWLNQWNSQDRDLGARILDSIYFFDRREIVKCLQLAFDQIPRSDLVHNGSRRCFYVSLTGPARSGDEMISIFRTANGLIDRKYREQFVYPSELVKMKLSEADTVVLVDDFAGTGNQAVQAWNGSDASYQELLSGAGKVYLILAAVTKKAIQQISNDTGMFPIAGKMFRSRDDLFSNDCHVFSSLEKQKVLVYSSRASRKIPKGYGDCGLLVVFQHRCPNNSIALLHCKSSIWSPLFPRV